LELSKPTTRTRKMAMDKYSQDESTLLKNLQDEEHTLMQTIGRYMGTAGEKTASEEASFSQAESRLTQVRDKIHELMTPKV
jgi:hypothetical protein